MSAKYVTYDICIAYPDSKVNGAHTGPTWVLSAADGSHFGGVSIPVYSVSVHLVKELALRIWGNDFLNNHIIILNPK